MPVLWASVNMYISHKSIHNSHGAVLIRAIWIVRNVVIKCPIAYIKSHQSINVNQWAQIFVSVHIFMRGWFRIRSNFKYLFSLILSLYLHRHTLEGLSILLWGKCDIINVKLNKFRLISFETYSLQAEIHGICSNIGYFE